MSSGSKPVRWVRASRPAAALSSSCPLGQGDFGRRQPAGDPAVRQRGLGAGAPFARQVVSCVDQWAAASRSVRILSFSSGLRVVYSPTRSPSTRTSRTCSPGSTLAAPSRRFERSVSWIAAPTAAGCETEKQARPFYLQQGAYLALLYGLEATDFHHENLIAAGEHPVLVDLEALFHPLLALKRQHDAATRADEQRYRETAARALAYERALFSVDEQDWPDLRMSGSRYVWAWCHGAPGIGLSRLAMPRSCEDSQVRTEIDAAVRITLAHGFGGNHSLCHGALGNLDLVSEAARRLDERALVAEVARLAGAILESICNHGWQCGVPGGAETPGLMTGLAGIGYGLLRLASPAYAPSVLQLSSPLRR